MKRLIRRRSRARGGAQPVVRRAPTAGAIEVREAAKQRVASHSDLKIGAAHDPAEKSADAMADHVMRMPQGEVHRKCNDCEEKDKTAHRKADGGVSAGATPASPVAAKAVAALGSGAPLVKAERAFFEPRFGADLSHVRVHEGAAADRAARAMDARAFALGDDIALASGETRDGEQGRHLMAHELAHVVRGGGVVRRTHHPAAKCHSFAPAKSFRQLIDLVREAEHQLAACGYTDVEERIHVLRGIFYGTKWSNDYKQEKSTVRNVGFQAYTVSGTPDDPRACLKCGMFDALSKSQDIVDHNRRVDFGHLIIGMDARRSRIARNVTIPSQGGTGLDISTWVGDLGGGAAMTAFQRIKNPGRRAKENFKGSDFGGSINLEGDVAGFLVGRPSENVSSAPTIDSDQTIADALAVYLEPKGPRKGGEWQSRSSNFLLALGGELNAKGNLTNRRDMEVQMMTKIYSFGCWYLVNRLRQNSTLTVGNLETASKYLPGASHETAEIFIDALVYCHAHPGAALQAHTDPAPLAKSSFIGAFCETAVDLMKGASLLSKLKKIL